MRVLHTGDWHVGRSLRGRDRTAEIGRALDEILSIVRSEGVHLILVAGDVFDSPNPSAEAEAVVYDFFRRTGELGVPSVIIAGNHDSAARLDGISGLLKSVNAHATGRVRAAKEGGVLHLQAGGAPVAVAALPFLSERRLVKAAQLLTADVASWRQTYQQGMAFFTDLLSKSFDASSVNLFMLHATLEGAKPSGSEHQFYLTNAYTIDPASLPAGAQYIAVGHLHRNQQLRDIPPVHYSGSIVQLDFGEAGETKVVKLVEVTPRKPAVVHDLPLTLETPLRVVRTSLGGLDRALESERAFPGYLKVVVRLDIPQPFLKDRVMQQYPNVIAFDPEMTKATVELSERVDADVRPLEAFISYYRERRNATPEPAVIAAFRELYRETRGEELPDSDPPPVPPEVSTGETRPRRSGRARLKKTSAGDGLGLDTPGEGLPDAAEDGLEEVDVSF